jgi:hypothetical protein
MEQLSPRTFQEVFDDHLYLSEIGDFESDIHRNYSPDTVVLMGNKAYKGYQGIRELALRLKDELPKASFQHAVKIVDKEIALLEWTAQSEKFEVMDGVDSYLFRDGKIVGQTIHYTLTKRRLH